MSRLPTAARRAGLVGAALGIAGVGAASGAVAGLAAERYVIGRPLLRRPQAVEPYGSLRGEPRVVLADDGIVLHVEVDRPSGEDELTIVLCHGYALNSGAFYYQRRDLRDLGRLVSFDQRGHGRSARGAKEHANIDQLGRDLYRVLDEVVPDGPVVLVGHSMGGMTVMALADEHPELFGTRVRGVALLSTSPGRLAEVTLGVPSALGRSLRRVAPRLVAVLGRRPDLVERSRRMASDVAFAATRRYSFASAVPPALVEYALEMILSTPFDVLAELFPAFDAHDKLDALGVLGKVETLLLCGERDLITPPEHTRGMSAKLPGAELVLVPDAGHLVILEHPDLVNAALRSLVRRALRASEAA